MYSEEYNDTEEGQSSSNFLVNFYYNNKILVWILVGVLVFILIMSLLTKGGSNGGANSNNYDVIIESPQEDSVTISIGNTYVMYARVKADANATIVWSVEDDKVAKVDNGTVTGLNYGKTKVTATYIDRNNVSHSADKEIVVADGDPNIQLQNVSFKEGDLFMPLNATYTIALTLTPPRGYVENQEFTSSNENVVIVDNSGLVTAVGEGEATISFSVNNGAFRKDLNVYVNRNYNNTEIIVTPEKISFDGEVFKIKVGTTEKLTFAVLPDNTDRTKLEWKSSDESVVTVDENGRIKGLKEGKATITLSSVNGENDRIDVEVESDIVEVTDINLSITDINMTAGQTQTIIPLVSPDNASNKALSFSSYDSSIANIVGNDTGTSATITAISAGTTTVSIKANNGVEKTITINVTGGTRTNSPTNTSSGGDSGTIKVRSNKNNLAKYHDEALKIPVEEESVVTVEIHSGVSYVMYGMTVYGSKCMPNIKQTSTFTITVPKGNMFEICVTKHKANGGEIAATSSGNYSDGALRYYVNTGNSGATNTSTPSNKICAANMYLNGNSCESCPSGYSSKAGSKYITDCYITAPLGKSATWIGNTHSINSCLDGYYYPSPRYVNYGSSSPCIKCQSGTSNADHSGCTGVQPTSTGSRNISISLNGSSLNISFTGYSYIKWGSTNGGSSTSCLPNIKATSNVVTTLTTGGAYTVCVDGYDSNNNKIGNKTETINYSGGSPLPAATPNGVTYNNAIKLRGNVANIYNGLQIRLTADKSFACVYACVDSSGSCSSDIEDVVKGSIINSYFEPLGFDQYFDPAYIGVGKWTRLGYRTSNDVYKFKVLSGQSVHMRVTDKCGTGNVVEYSNAIYSTKQ